MQPAVPATGNGTTNTVTNTTGATAYVSTGANGATMSNYYVNGSSVATTAAAYMMTVPAGQTCGLAYTSATPVWFWSQITPALPSSTVAATNTTGQNLSVVFLGSGSVSAVSVNGVTTNIGQTPAAYTAGTPLPAGATIAVTYSGALVWAWLDPIDLTLPHSDGTNYMQPNTVVPSGAAGYSPITVLPYAAHAEGGLSGWGVGISN